MSLLTVVLIVCVFDNMTHEKPRFRFYSVVMGLILLLMASVSPMNGVTVVCTLCGIGLLAWRYGVALANGVEKERM